jgi:hypothetical protein
MHPPSHLERVSAGSIGCLRVTVYVVVCTCFSCGLEYCAVYGVCRFQCGAFVFANELSKARVEVWQLVFGGGVVGVGVEGCGPCSEAADGGIGLRKCEVREDIVVGNAPGTRICRIVVSDSRVGFDFTYMGCEVLLVSYLYVVVGFHKEIAVWVMFVVERVDDVVSDRVDAKGVVCEDVELGGVVVEF